MHSSLRYLRIPLSEIMIILGLSNSLGSNLSKIYYDLAFEKIEKAGLLLRCCKACVMILMRMSYDNVLKSAVGNVF